jgi:hypothetical protein
MGLLDDAIREHLDLKRRRGADPSEIAREEHEALGPIRRGQPAAEPMEAPEADGALERPHADESFGADAGLDEPGAAYADDDFAYEAPDERERDEPPVPYEPPRTHAEPYAEHEDESATPPHGDPLLHQQTREFSTHELDEALGQSAPAPSAEPADAPSRDEREREAGDRDGEDEDVLEETPDFLQETPEHDRLWFEQKPPKDFDF